MYREYVNIIDLKEDSDISAFNNKDLYLKSSILSENIEAEGIDENSYKSNSFSALSIINDVFSKPRVITNRWEFSVPGRAPTISATINPERYNSEILMSTDNRRDAIYLSGGQYTQRTNSGYDAMSSSLSVSQCTIANLDYVNRIAAWIYEDIINRIDDIINIQKKRTFVGQIIHSTILSTKAMVKNEYGQDTDWLQHVGYTLRGAANINSIVIPNKAEKTNGDNNNRIMPLIKHQHTVSHKHSFSAGGTHPSFSPSSVIKSVTQSGQNNFHGGTPHSSQWTANMNTGQSDSNSNNSSSFTIELNNNSIASSTGSASTVDIKQPYKNVYIWERIS